ncbi:MAG: peptide deformylase [Planctomycetota bacterium]
MASSDTPRSDAPGPQASETQASGPQASGTEPFDVVLFPDPVLRKETQDVEAFDGALEETVQRMFAAMYESRGVGLAAPQVGLSQRVFVLNDEGDSDKPELSLALINPTIESFAGKKTRHEEGCLSLPGVYAEVSRPERCTVRFHDLQGNERVEEFEGFRARIVQHEYDHLQGVLLVDRMTPSDKQRNRGAVEELKDAYRRHLAALAEESE